MDLFKIASFNTRGLLQNDKRKSIFQYFKERECDVVLLQETHSKSNLEQVWKNEWFQKGQILYSHSETQGGGVLCLLKSNYKTINEQSIVHGRLQKIVIDINDMRIVLYNAHAPNYDKDQITFFKKIFDELTKDLTYDFILLAGDFNVVMNNFLDKKNGINTKKKCITELQNILENFELCEEIMEKTKSKEKNVYMV